MMQTLQEIATRAEKTKISQLQVIEGICDGRLPDIKPAGKRKFVPFVKTVRALRDLTEKVIPFDIFSSSHLTWFAREHRLLT